MESYRTEEEQVEALRRWWQEYGRTTLIVVALAVAGVFGYRAWDEQQRGQRERAAALYQNLLSAEEQWRSDGDAQQLRTARHLAETLRSEHAGTAYARLAALYQARLALLEDNPASAEEPLRWALEAGPEDALGQLARLRLAQLYYAEEDEQRALDTLEQGQPGPYAPGYAVLRGDILYARGDMTGARQAWQRARELGGETARDPVLELKLEHVAMDTDGEV